MKADIRKIRKSRRYSEEFKKDLVQKFEQGKFSVCQMERLYGVPNNTIYKWIYKYSTFNEKGYRIIEMKKSQTNKVKELEDRIKELERLLGRKQIEIDYLETMMEVA
jgi:transposase-like protein